MSLDVPVSIDIFGVVGLVAGDFDLFETPLWQVDIASSKITAQSGMLQSESSRQSSYLTSVARCNIFDNLHGPVILLIANGGISITRDFAISLGDRSCNLVGVKISASLRMYQTQNIAICDKLWIGFGIILCLTTVRVKPPLVVGIFVVITGDLLLT